MPLCLLILKNKNKNKKKNKNWALTFLFQGQIVSQVDLVLKGLQWSTMSNLEHKKKVEKLERPQMAPKE